MDICGGDLPDLNASQSQCSHYGAVWIACYIVARASPPIADAIGWGLHIIYTGICVVTFFFVRYALILGSWLWIYCDFRY